MTTPYEKSFHIPSSATDCFGRLKPSHILDYIQEVSGDHSALLGAGSQTLARQGLFWAVVRHRVQITRLPAAGETLTVRTWPMPTTRTGYPRSTIFYDEAGQEVLRAITLWALMDQKSRGLVLPGKSGVAVEGLLLGSELALPGSVAPKAGSGAQQRTVRFTDLDCNGHMNNCRYLDWTMDLLPRDFHREHSLAEFTVCYLSEARQGETLTLSWEAEQSPCITVSGQRQDALSAGKTRVFAVQLQF